MNSNYFKITFLIKLFLIISLPLFIYTSCYDNPPQIKSYEESDTIILDEFGIPVDSFLTKKGQISKNQTLADILIPYNISYKTITEIYYQSKNYFDFKKIKPGMNYTIYLENDSLQDARIFIYEIDKISYIKVDFNDSLNISLFSKDIKILEKSIVGVINASLYQTFSDLNISPILPSKLSEIFAWQIDFYALQSGDSITAFYEELYVDNKSVGIGNVLFAKFLHKGQPFLAFLFNKDDKFEYFDENGNSLQKEFLKAPLKFNRISSRYSNSRFHPILRTYRPHLGIDYASAIGTPVQSVGDGTVVEVATKNGAGKYVKIKHNSVYSSAYLHLSKFGKNVKKGVKIKQGQVIGYVGNSGLSTGPHLDFRFWKNGSLVNYLTQKFPSTKSVSNEDLEDFINIRNNYLLKFSNLELADK